MRTILIIFIYFILVGCGKTPIEPNTELISHNFYSVLDDTALPVCDETKLGWLFYVSETKLFKNCNGTEYEEINLKGDVGLPGIPGPEARDNVAHEYDCINTSLDLDPSAEELYGVFTSVFLFDSGMASVFCESSFYTPTLGFWDSSSCSSFATKTRVDTDREIYCLNFYNTCTYHFQTNEVVYKKHGELITRTVPCFERNLSVY